MKKLPKQSPSHIKGRRAIQTIRNLMPESWIIREPNPDYGVDLEVEVWYENPTGRIANLQVKYISDPFTKGFQIKRSTLNYLYTKPNSFIVFVSGDRVDVSPVKCIIEIFNDLNQGETETITIPVIFNSDKYGLFLQERDLFYYYPRNVIETAVSGELYRIDPTTGKNTKIPVIYYGLFTNENEFWTFEYYLKLGEFYKDKKNRMKIIPHLKRKYGIESKIGKAGILMCFNILDCCDSWTRESSENLLSNYNSVILISCLNTLTEPYKDINYNLLINYHFEYQKWYSKNHTQIDSDKYENYFNMFHKDVLGAVEIAIINSIYRINDEKSTIYLLGTCLPYDPYDNICYLSLSILEKKISESAKYKLFIMRILKQIDVKYEPNLDPVEYLKTKAKTKRDELLKSY